MPQQIYPLRTAAFGENIAPPKADWHDLMFEVTGPGVIESAHLEWSLLSGDTDQQWPHDPPVVALSMQYTVGEAGTNPIPPEPIDTVVANDSPVFRFAHFDEWYTQGGAKAYQGWGSMSMSHPRVARPNENLGLWVVGQSYQASTQDYYKWLFWLEWIVHYRSFEGIQ